MSGQPTASSREFTSGPKPAMETPSREIPGTQLSSKEFTYRMMALGTVGSLAVAVVALGALLWQSFLETPPPGERGAVGRASQHGTLQRQPGGLNRISVGGSYFTSTGSTVYAAGIPVLQERSSVGASPSARAQRVAARLDNLLNSRDAEPGRIFLTTLKRRDVIAYRAPRARPEPIATVDPKTAAALGYPGGSRKLAAWWVDLLRDHLLILQGKRPRWTARYARPMLQLYQVVKRGGTAPPTPDSVQHAALQLPLPVRASLSSLYAEVPVDYRIGGPVRPRPRPVPGGAAVLINGMAFLPGSGTSIRMGVRPAPQISSPTYAPAAPYRMMARAYRR